MKRLHLWANSKNQMPSLCVFEDGEEHKGELIDVAKRELPEELRPTFQPKILAPLQAADVVAWDLRNTTVKIEQSAELASWRKSRERLDAIPDDFGIYKQRIYLGSVVTRVSPCGRPDESLRGLSCRSSAKSVFAIEIICLTRFINFSRGVSPGTGGNFIFAFDIALYLGAAWRHVVGIASLPVSSLYVSRRPNAEPAASMNRLASLPFRSL